MLAVEEAAEVDVVLVGAEITEEKLRNTAQYVGKSLVNDLSKLYLVGYKELKHGH